MAGPPLAGFEILVGKLQRSLPRFLRVYLRRFHSLDLLAYLKPPPPDLLTLVRSLSLFREGLVSLLSRVQCGKWTEFAKLRDPGSGEWPSTTVLVACPGWSAGVRTNTIQGVTEKKRLWVTGTYEKSLEILKSSLPVPGYARASLLVEGISLQKPLKRTPLRTLSHGNSSLNADPASAIPAIIVPRWLRSSNRTVSRTVAIQTTFGLFDGFVNDHGSSFGNGRRAANLS